MERTQLTTQSEQLQSRVSELENRNAKQEEEALGKVFFAFLRTQGDSF